MVNGLENILEEMFTQKNTTKENLAEIGLKKIKMETLLMKKLTRAQKAILIKDIISLEN